MLVDVLTGGLRLEQAGALARDAHRSGFSGVVVAEAGRTAYLQCAAAALGAPIDVLTGVAVAFVRSPMVTASIAWELADATGGRFRLGLGTQVRAHIERRYGVPFDPPGPRLREYVGALRAIFRAFRGEPLAFEGRYWNLSLLPQMWSPGPISVADPPIDLAAVNPWMLRMAGELADGVHVHPLNHARYLDEIVVPNVAEGAHRAERAPAELQLIVPCFTVVGDTEEERSRWRDLARMQVAFYGSTPNYAFIFDLVGAEGTTARLRERQKVGDLAGMAASIDDDLLAHFVVSATWDELSDAIIARYDGVAARVVLYFSGIAWSQDARTFARMGEVARDVVKRTSAP